jgi:RNA polymerase sigma-70 factor (ECF subfamily)
MATATSSRSAPVRVAALAPASAATTGHVLDPETLGDHIDRLFRAAWALCGSREDAEDLVQDTYARVLARPRLLRKDDDLGYLLRVMRNTFISSRRAAARRPQPAGQDPEALNLPESQADTAGSQGREVIRAIHALPAEFRNAVVAVDVAGLSYGEAAKALRVPQSTIGSRLFRARNELAERFTTTTTTTTASRSTTGGTTTPTTTADPAMATAESRREPKGQ